MTTLHPTAFAVVLALGAAMLLAPRRYAFAPLLVLACFISPAQRVVIATLDFNLLRILIVFGWIRLFTCGERPMRFRTIMT